MKIFFHSATKFLLLAVLFTLPLATLIAQPQQQPQQPFSTNPFAKSPISNPFGGDRKNAGEKKGASEKKDPRKEAAKPSDVLNSKGVDKLNNDAIQQDPNADGGENGVALDNEEKYNIENKEKASTSSASGGSKKAVVRSENDVYGMDYFDFSDFSGNEKTVIVPSDNYRLGVGDEIVVNIFGSSEMQSAYTIGKDGSIYPQYLGRIPLAGMTFESAKNVVSNRFRRIIGAGSNIIVNLGQVRTIRVSFVGEVNKSGTLSMSAYTTAINALANAGGLTNLANLRAIEIRRDGHVVHSIDLYKFLKGYINEDQFLQDGDVINVTTYERLVKASGSFRRSMFYQLAPNENLSNLVDLAGGPTFDARYSSIQVRSTLNEESKIITCNLKDLKGVDYELFDGDIVTIKKINAYYNNAIEVSGGVNYPDSYQILPGERLSSIIKKAGGLVADAYMPRAYLYRGDTNFREDISKLDLASVLNGDPKNDIEVLPGDRIMVISKKTFMSSYEVSIVGCVKAGTTMPYNPTLTLKDLLLKAGGLRAEAENGRIEIASIADSANDYTISLKENPEWKIIQINPNLELDASIENYQLKPFDKVYVRKKAEFKLMENVSVNGEVMYPGEYVLLGNNERMSSLLKRCGGLKKNADVAAATLSRSTAGNILIDMKKVLENLEKNNIEYDLKLMPGDVINIPQRSELISVGGQVLNPISMYISNKPTTIKEVVGSCGGYSERPWKDRISVLYPNGRTKTTKRIFFVRKYPKVEQGCIVNVPMKPERKGFQISWGDITTFSTSTMTTMATLVTAWAIVNSKK